MIRRPAGKGYMSDHRDYLDARFEGGPLDKQVRPVPGFDTYSRRLPGGDLAVYRRRQLVVRAEDGVLVGFVFAHAFTEPR